MTVNTFWKFSLRFWGLPGAETACLYLQDNMKADVNIVLFCIYAAKNGYIVTHQGLQHIIQETAPWRENVVLPLREVRHHMRTIKDEDPELYKNIQAAELGAEKWAQSRMSEYTRNCCLSRETEISYNMEYSLKKYLIDCLGNEGDKVQSAIDHLISIQAPASDSS